MGINIKQLWQDRADVAIDIQSGKEAMQAMLDNPASRDAANVACFSEEQEDLYSRMEETLKGNQAVAIFDLATGEERRVETSRPVTHGVVVSPDSRYAFVTNEAVASFLDADFVTPLQALGLDD